MKVIHIITGLNDGGAEGTLYRLISSSYNEVEYIVISLMGIGKYGTMLESLNIKVVSLNMPRGKVTIKGLQLMFSILKKERPDVVQTWMYHADLLGGVVARLSGCRNVFWGVRHANLSMDVNSKSTLFIAKICALLSSYIPIKIITCAEEAVRAHQSFGYKGDFIVIPNGYNTEQFCPNDNLGLLIREELNVVRAQPLLGFVARWDSQKDHENLFQALVMIKGRYPNVVLALIGTGCDFNNDVLVEKINKLRLRDNIRLLGCRYDIPAIMNGLDIHVLSSCGEAFPNVLAEAMSVGTPCVSTDVGDASLIIGNSGWIASPSNSKELASMISLALDEMKNTAAWKQRKIECTYRIKSMYSLEKMVSNYIDCWSINGLNRVT